MKHLSMPSSSPFAVQRGFTLVELIVAIALLAILTTLAVPSFTETLRGWRRDSATRELASSLNLARSESIKSSRQMVLCPSTNGTACVAGNEWRNGWMLYVDDGAGIQANANNQVYNNGERVLKFITSRDGLASMVSPAGVLWLRFLPNGLMLTNAAGDATFTVTPTGATAATKVNRVTVSRVGRVSIVTELP